MIVAISCSSSTNNNIENNNNEIVYTSKLNPITANIFRRYVVELWLSFLNITGLASCKVYPLMKQVNETYVAV